MRFWKSFAKLVIISFPVLFTEGNHAFAGSGKATCPGVNDNQSFYWFDLQTGKRLLEDIKLCAVATRQVSLLENKISLQKQKIQIYHEQIGLWKALSAHTNSIAETWKKGFKDATVLVKEDPPWYRLKVLWFFLGAAIGGGLAVALSYSLSR